MSVGSRLHRRARRLAAAAVLLGAGLLAAAPATGTPLSQPVTISRAGAASAAAVPAPSTAAPPATTLPLSPGATSATAPPGSTGGGLTTSTLGVVPAQPPADPGLFDIPGRIREAVDEWFQGLVASAVSPALDLLGRTLLATPGVATGPRARELWQVSLGLADGAYVLVVTIAGVVLLTHESLQTQYWVKEIGPRLLVGLVAANLSFWLAGSGIDLANAASAALLGQGVDAAHVTATIETLALAPLQDASPFTVLLLGALVVLAVVLAGTCMVRVLVTVFLVVAAPVMLAAHALPQTEGLARFWWRAMAACLGVQVAQALALTMAVRVFFEADRASVLGFGSGHLLDVMVVCCLFWLLIRIPSWAVRAVLEGGRRGSFARLVRSMVVVRTVRAVGGAVRAVRP